MGVTRRIVALVVILGCVLGAAPVARAAADEAVFRVDGVAVDVTAADAETARARALLDGQRAAFARLVARIVPAAAIARLPTLDDDALTRLVKGFEVGDERVAPKRYIATLSFRFDGPAVSALLRENQVPFALTRARPLLVLPLYDTDRGLLLWEDDNAWRLAWSRLAPSDALIDVIAPLGELADITAIDAKQAAAGERDALDRIAARYDGGDVAVATAEAARDSLVETPSVRVTVYRYRNDTVSVGGGTYAGEAWETLDDVLGRAAEETRRQIEEAWKEANLLRFDQVQNIEVDVIFGTLAEWLDIRRRINAVAVVRRARVTALSTRFARVAIEFLGDDDQLTEALAAKNLVLRREADLWMLRERGATEAEGKPASDIAPAEIPETTEPTEPTETTAPTPTGGVAGE